MLPIIRDPSPMPPVEALICESTYGNKKHVDIETAKHELRDIVIKTAKRGGKVIIPAFSLSEPRKSSLISIFCGMQTDSRDPHRHRFATGVQSNGGLHETSGVL